MRYAKSLRYGGDLVDAADCDWNSFKKLVPLCPICSQPVYLRKQAERSLASGKVAKIPAHWAHFKAASEEDKAACEARVSNYTEADRQAIARKARGQRAKWINKFFWSIWIAERCPEEGQQRSLEQSYVAVKALPWLDIDGLAEKLCEEHRLHGMPTLKTILDNLEQGEAIAVTRNGQEYWAAGQGQVDFFDKSLPSLDILAHRRYCLEVLGFLMTPRAMPIFANMLAFGLQNSLMSCVNGFLVPGIPPGLFSSKKHPDGGVEVVCETLLPSPEQLTALMGDAILFVLTQIAITPWVSAFQKQVNAD